MTPPSLCFVIPCYNASTTILNTLESLVSQTDPDFSVVVIDDCSTDQTVEIAQSFSSRLNIQIFYTSFNTGGPATPRNIGITQSHSDYVCLLDADDFVLPSKVASIRHLIKTFNPDVLFHPLLLKSDNKKLFCSLGCDSFEFNSSQLKHLLQYKAFPICNSGVVLNNSFLVSNDIKYCEASELISGEDADLIYQISYTSASIFYSHLPLAIYTDNAPTSIQFLSRKVPICDTIINRFNLNPCSFPSIFRVRCKYLYDQSTGIFRLLYFAYFVMLSFLIVGKSITYHFKYRG